jgi:uncharacterized protein (DUF2062 family)
VNTIYQYFRKLYTTRVLIPVSNIRKQGFSAETLALSISIGIIGGAFPAIGFASYICLILTLAFKQNIIIVQVVNWLVYPLQILLIIPFMKLGYSIFTGGELTITLHQVVAAFQSGIMNGIKLIGIISLYGIIAWAVIAIPTLFILYSSFLLIFRYFNRVKLKMRQVVVNNPNDQNLQPQPVNPSLILETLPTNNNGL